MFGCCALQNTGRNRHFQGFNGKKLKKQEICSKNVQKTRFLSLHQNAGRLFYSPKNSRPTFWCKLKKFCIKFLLFAIKNAENDYFSRRLECAAPKRWSKYTTNRANQPTFRKQSSRILSQLKSIFFKHNTTFIFFSACIGHNYWSCGQPFYNGKQWNV